MRRKSRGFATFVRKLDGKAEDNVPCGDELCPDLPDEWKVFPSGYFSKKRFLREYQRLNEGEVVDISSIYLWDTHPAGHAFFSRNNRKPVGTLEPLFMALMEWWAEHLDD